MDRKLNLVSRLVLLHRKLAQMQHPVLIGGRGKGSLCSPLDRIHAQGMAFADVDTRSQAVHDVYCGIMADHSHPDDKDRQQAQAMMDALQRASA